MPQVTPDQLLTSAIILIPLSFIPALIAKKKGRNFFLWYLYAFGFFIFALIHSMMLMPRKQEEPKSIKQFAVPSEFVVNKRRVNYCFIGCPMDALSYTVLKNVDERKMTVNLNLFAEKNVKAFDINLEMLDTMNNRIIDKGFFNVEYKEMVSFNISEFPYTTYVNFTIKNVYMEEGRQWTLSGEKVEYNIDLLDGSELEKLRQLTNSRAICLPYKTEDYWVCSCSKANNTDTCVLCGMDKDKLFDAVDKKVVLELKNDLIRRNNLRQFNVSTTTN